MRFGMYMLCNVSVYTKTVLDIVGLHKIQLAGYCGWEPYTFIGTLAATDRGLGVHPEIMNGPVRRMWCASNASGRGRARGCAVPPS